jgi:thiamine phosphate synthase YjbQ (UPF0047 family)
MHSFRKELWFETARRREFINITPQVENCIKESKISEWIDPCKCNAHHCQCVYQ